MIKFELQEYNHKLLYLINKYGNNGSIDYYKLNDLVFKSEVRYLLNLGMTTFADYYNYIDGNITSRILNKLKKGDKFDNYQVFSDIKFDNNVSTEKLPDMDYISLSEVDNFDKLSEFNIDYSKLIKTIDINPIDIVKSFSNDIDLLEYVKEHYYINEYLGNYDL